MASAKYSNARSVGTRPALVCGFTSSPAASSSASTARTEADERSSTRRCTSTFDDTGSPVAMNSATVAKRIRRVRCDNMMKIPWKN